MSRISIKSLSTLLTSGIVFAIITTLPKHVLAQETFETESYTIKMKENCGEGHVTCDNVTFTCTNKKRKETIELKGKTLHSKGIDDTPGHFQGYEFCQKDICYRILGDDTLTIVQEKSTSLLEEHGAWVK